MRCVAVRRRIVVVAAGQGAQYCGMGINIYENDLEFRKVCDRLLNRPGTLLEHARTEWLNLSPSIENKAYLAQPMLMTLSLATCYVLKGRGIQIDALIGHSAGELSLALFAGLVSVEKQSSFIEQRASILHSKIPGSMCAVRAPVKVLQSIINTHCIKVWIACINSPDQCIVSGREKDINSFADVMHDLGITFVKVATDYPFHTPLVRSLAARYENYLSRIELRPISYPLMSAMTASWISSSEAKNPSFWSDQIWKPIRFWDAISKLLDEGDWTFVDIGPGDSLSALISRHPKFKSGASEIITMMPRGVTNPHAEWFDKIKYLMSI